MPNVFAMAQLKKVMLEGYQYSMDT